MLTIREHWRDIFAKLYIIIWLRLRRPLRPLRDCLAIKQYRVVGFATIIIIQLIYFANIREHHIFSVIIYIFNVLVFFRGLPTPLNILMSAVSSIIDVISSSLTESVSILLSLLSMDILL